MPISSSNSSSKPSYSDLEDVNASLLEKVTSLEGQLAWFKNQIFEKKSEKFTPTSPAEALPLFDKLPESSTPPENKIEVSAHSRKPRGKTKYLGDNKDSGLRFDDNVEIVTEDILPDEVQELSEDEYTIVGEEISDTLASKTSRNFVHRRRYLKVKLKQSPESKAAPVLLKQAVSDKIFPQSYLAISFIVDMFLDKCLYSIPIYRQHQRLSRDGIHIARNTLVTNFNRYAKLLEPLGPLLLSSILYSRILAIDETPMKVGVDKLKHKMKSGYIWPVMGDANQIIYIYHESRGAKVLEELLKGFSGTVLSDGYSAYKSYINQLIKDGSSDSVTHATCWVHARRKFVKLREDSQHYQKAMGFFSELYRIEEQIKGLSNAKRYQQRNELSKPIVDNYYSWLRSFSGTALVASNKLLKDALRYSLEREESMRVFLRDPALALDTNYLEREIRPIAIGRKNHMFCWTELGAESLCLMQSLIRTCLLQEVDPRSYLIDVIQRISQRDNAKDDLSDLLPHIWKDEFGDNPRGCFSLKNF